MIPRELPPLGVSWTTFHDAPFTLSRLARKMAWIWDMRHV